MAGIAVHEILHDFVMDVIAWVVLLEGFLDFAFLFSATSEIFEDIQHGGELLAALITQRHTTYQFVRHMMVHVTALTLRCPME